MTQNISAGARPQVTSPAKVAFASFIGTAVEWYDYFLFGTAAVLVFNHQFFPNLDPTASTLASLATFAVAFIARPLGGIVFGHFGDRFSRKSMLVWSLLMMGLSTFLVGLLPTYDQVGLLAPALLVAARVIQGVAVGGEWGGAVLMALEHAPESKRSFYASWPQAGVPAGVVLSSFAFFLVQLLPEEQLQAWGWRIPFLFSAVLIVIGMAIRLKLTESPEFEAAKQLEQPAARQKIPFIEMLRSSKRALIVSVFSLAGSNTLFYVATVYLLSYGTSNLTFDRGMILLAVGAGALLDVFAIPLVATFADRFGRRRMMIVGSLVTVACSFPIFWLFNLGGWGVFAALVIAMPIAHSFVYATVSGFIATLFTPSVRFTGTSVAYQVGGIVASAPAPILATMLYTQFGSYVAVAAYLLVTNLIALIAVLFAPKEVPITRAVPVVPAAVEAEERRGLHRGAEAAGEDEPSWA
ncbi:MHS family MFS transporter [Leucobacter sp. CSA2]|uniref:Putative proline/betaine transporter n=1 Tax=Leucobacter edaphi TaxID=2796472 RepID=A0A934QAN4_9MICO|nr:MFS transporter [Leucobacter edaphi]MBK0420613.1 MHS family MFS transporter [Leucobacter edaphi]